jgi:hypothetical protein
MNAKQLHAEVVRLFFLDAVCAEEKDQGRALTKNEKIAFKCGLYRGMSFDLFRDGKWDEAAANLKKKENNARKT